MIIFPAIDIKDGVCVRLIKGDFRQITSYENTPLDQAKKYFKDVRVFKPLASRKNSKETFIICKILR